MLTNVDREMEVFQREVFGPVLTWNTFKDDGEAIEIANDTTYGLAAMIFSRDERRVWKLASQVTAGIRELAAPFGGAQDSGIGREGGNWSEVDPIIATAIGGS